jgi:hypothetical protein
MRLNAAAQLIDRIVTGDDARTCGRIAPIERFDGDTNRIAAKRT